MREEWVLVASHRGGGPGLGPPVGPAAEPFLAQDPGCPFCPGGKLAPSGTASRHSKAWGFAADLPRFGGSALVKGDDFYRVRPAAGTTEGIAYHPDHAKTFADLADDEAAAVIELWAERCRELSLRPEIDHVLIVEERVAARNAPTPHPHCQIHAGNLIPGTIAREIEAARKHFRKTGQHLGQDILARELAGPRVVTRNDHFVACVPWFALRAHEIHVLPGRQVAALTDLDAAERRSLALTIREVAIRYDNLWRAPAPYVMTVHQAPTDGQDYSAYPFHLEFHPLSPGRWPGAAGMGWEAGGGSTTNESDPDAAAAELRAASPVRAGNRPA